MLQQFFLLNFISLYDSSFVLFAELLFVEGKIKNKINNKI